MEEEEKPMIDLHKWNSDFRHSGLKKIEQVELIGKYDGSFHRSPDYFREVFDRERNEWIPYDECGGDTPESREYYQKRGLIPIVSGDSLPIRVNGREGSMPGMFVYYRKPDSDDPRLSKEKTLSFIRSLLRSEGAVNDENNQESEPDPDR